MAICNVNPPLHVVMLRGKSDARAGPDSQPWTGREGQGAGHCTDTSINRVLPGRLCSPTGVNEAGGPRSSADRDGFFCCSRPRAAISVVQCGPASRSGGGTHCLLFFQISGGVLALGRDGESNDVVQAPGELALAQFLLRLPSHPQPNVSVLPIHPSSAPLSLPDRRLRPTVRVIGPFPGIPCSCPACLPTCQPACVPARLSCPLPPAPSAPSPSLLPFAPPVGCSCAPELAGSLRLDAKRSRGASVLSATAKSGPSIAGFRFAFRPSPSSAFDCPLSGSSLARL